MGFSISWIAFKAMGVPEVLRRTGLRSLGTSVQHGDEGTARSPLSLAEIPTGWTILLSGDFNYGSNSRLASLSPGATVVACQAEEHAIFSAAHCYIDSREAWSVCHDSQRGLYDLSTSGVPPATLEPIRSRLAAEQSRGDSFPLNQPSGKEEEKYVFELLKGFGGGVEDQSLGPIGQTGRDDHQRALIDYMFDVPVELAAELTGFQHTRSEFEWGRPHFIKLEQIE